LTQDPGAVLSKDFQTPYVRERLDALLLFASVLRPLVVSLSKATDVEGKPLWFNILDILAERIASQVPNLTHVSETTLIWKQFTSDLSIASLKPLAAGVIQSIQRELEKSLAAWNPNFGLDYLVEANGRASRRVAQMEVQKLGRQQAETVPVLLLIEYDPKSEQQHASSVRGTSEIRWRLQLEEYSLWGALIADRVFEHEYFCHLLPVNTHLSAEIREGFLDGVLQFQHSLCTTTGADEALAESRWNYALHRFRDDLWDHFDETLDEDQLKLRNLGQSPKRRGSNYWRLVGTVFDCPEGAAEAQQLKEMLLRL
jgi:hypothetical protein